MLIFTHGEVNWGKRPSSQPVAAEKLGETHKKRRMSNCAELMIISLWEFNIAMAKDNL